MGEFYIGNQKVIGGYVGTQNIRKIYFGTTLVVTEPPLCLTSKQNGSTVTLSSVGSISTWSGIYSLDGVNWNTYTLGTTIRLRNGEKVYFKGVVSMSQSLSRHIQFVLTGKIEASGNVMSLCVADNYIYANTAIPYPGTFYGLFQNCSALITAPVLPATILKNYCYTDMFKGTGITNPPTLPATSVEEYCYASMFEGSGILTAPSLPATALAGNCYDGMFKGTPITTPPTLPATTLASYCYYEMFSGCSSLATAPTLPATQMQLCCYMGMFADCTSLISTPSLPATQLADSCYEYMFAGCTSLTTVPKLPATTLYDDCYDRMFSGCTSLYVGTAVSSAPCTWVFPSANTVYTENSEQSRMFRDCAGSRTTDDLIVTANARTYRYTQNEPI